MTRMLEAAAVEDYRRDGYLFPVDVLGAGEAAEALRRYEGMAAAHGGRLPTRINQKPHLLYPWIDALVRHPRILDAVEDVLGPDLLCWGSQFFAKATHDSSFVSWHQDATYWGLSSPDVMTAWLALTPSTPENGNMRVIPGTHRQQMAHTDTFAESNLLSRGQEVAVTVDEDDAVDITLQPGQISLHHVLIVHGSEPNPSSIPRIGLAIRYVPTSVYQTSGIRESATLVRGTDRHGHFDLETPPEAELHPDAVARHTAIVERQFAILYAGAAKAGKRGTLDTGTSS